MLEVSGRADQDRCPMDHAGAAALSERDRAILDFERSWWRDGSGTKEALIRTRFQLSPARYRQLLATLLEVPQALAYDPLTVKRLRRRREQRRRARLEGRRADPESR